MMDENSILINTDSYKVSQFKQYPKGTQVIYSYLESRGGMFDETLFFGLQYIIKKYLAGKVVTKKRIIEAEPFITEHFGGNTEVFNRERWEYILNNHGGYLPLKIKAVPEGTVVGVSNVLITVENTDPKCYWLTNYVETLLVQCWYPITVATLSYNIKKIIQEYLEKTGDEKLINFKLHDFGFRGVSSVESARIGGCAHLVNFLGTDTMAALVMAKNYYDCDMAGFSIPATEHSTITSWGKEHEEDAMRNMLEQYPTGTIACVSDSFDIYNACRNIWGKKLKSLIANRDGTLVVRPDSGDPVTVVSQVITILGERFGWQLNDKKYKVLNPHVRIIQGDGVDIASIKEILYKLKEMGWSADNIAFGSGGALLQKMNRDTQKFAFKCSAIMIDGEWHDVYKQPITDTGKNSKRGRLALVYLNDKKFHTIEKTDMSDKLDKLQDVFINGVLVNETTLSDVRMRSRGQL